MKQFKEFEDVINSLVNESENYIVFNDGKAIRKNLDEKVLITLDTICESEYRKDCENEIIKNSSFWTNVNIEKDVNIKCIYLNDEESNMTYFYNIKKGINVNIVNIYLEFNCSTNVLVEYNVGEDASLNVCDFSSVKSEINEFNNYYLEENSKLVLNNLKVNDNLVNGKYNVYLLKKYAECTINNSIINASGLKQAYNYVIHHLYRLTKSELIGYGVSKNDSILNIDTNGVIKKGASRSEMHQKSKGIILDLASTISASPLLEIDEFDCMASHGASIGAIDESDLFYLMSRGLPREQSQNLIINGFFNPYLSKLHDEGLIKHISEVIKEHIE